MKSSFSLLSRTLSFQPWAAAGHAGSRRPQSPPRPWEGDVSRARLGPELSSNHVSCWSWPPVGRDVPTRVPIKSSWHSPGIVTVPTCIWLALEKGAKFLQHKDQSTSVRQGLSLGAEARQRHDWVYLPAGLLCGGWAAASPGLPSTDSVPLGSGHGGSAGACAGFRLRFFPSPTLSIALW